MSTTNDKIRQGSHQIRIFKVFFSFVVFVILRKLVAEDASVNRNYHIYRVMVKIMNTSGLVQSK